MSRVETLLKYARRRLKDVLTALYDDGLRAALEIHKDLLVSMEQITVGEIELTRALHHELNRYEYLLDFVEEILNDAGAGL